MLWNSRILHALQSLVMTVLGLSEEVRGMAISLRHGWDRLADSQGGADTGRDGVKWSAGESRPGRELRILAGSGLVPVLAPQASGSPAPSRPDPGCRSRRTLSSGAVSS